MARKLPRMKSEEVIRVLDRHGCELVSQRGSHQKWRNLDTGRQVIVPFHKGKHLPLGTMRSIIEGSGITEKEFRL
ncbi:MAG: hypothetical protein A2158_02405 [Chloroflexi bacterium RBG_13_46_14]|nr:MAG: hypothetical protein A2158_02405 [Chloroflexi bacterium RBG_13_46_14]